MDVLVATIGKYSDFGLMENGTFSLVTCTASIFRANRFAWDNLAHR